MRQRVHVQGWFFALLLASVGLSVGQLAQERPTPQDRRTQQDDRSPAAQPPQRQDPPRLVGAVRARELRAWDTEITRQLRSGDLQLTRTDKDLLVSGRVHERLTQFHRGVRVFGGELVRQTDGFQTLSVFGTLYTGIDVDPEPLLTPESASAIVRRLTGVTLAADRRLELMVVPRSGGGFALAYRAKVMTDTDLAVYFVDAKAGGIVFSYSELETVVGTGTGVLGDQKKVSTTLSNGTYLAWDQMRPAVTFTYDMKGDLTRTRLYLNGLVTLTEADMGASSSTTWNDPATVDGHAYAGWTYDYYFKRFSRSGLDGRNMAMKGLVHPVNRADWSSYSSSVIGLYYLNAFYAGEGIMVYGEGLPPTVSSGGYKWTYFSGALDVVAHELTHGVTDYSSGLIYLNESGALNESFSDMMGTSVEFYYQQPGSTYLRADYTIGEDLTTPMGGFRSMANPGAYGDPDHYSRRYLGMSDNGGVHHNSGISNQAFYLAIEGGTNRTSGLSVTGVGSASRDRIERVFYRAFTQMLPANATFAVARAATIQAARDLYGTDSTVEQAVTQAWTAVGVF